MDTPKELTPELLWKFAEECDVALRCCRTPQDPELLWKECDNARREVINVLRSCFRMYYNDVSLTGETWGDMESNYRTAILTIAPVALYKLSKVPDDFFRYVRRTCKNINIDNVLNP